MPRWTTSHHISTTKPNNVQYQYQTCTLDHTVKVGKEIWIWNEVYYPEDDDLQLELLVFDTETCDISEVKISRPVHPTLDQVIQVVTNHKNIIYGWFGLRYMYCGIHTLYKLDIHTMKWEMILEMYCNEINEDTPIINDTMFVVDNDERTGVVHLITIDLIRKEVISRRLLNIENKTVNLYVQNEQFYLLETCENSRKVFLVENGVLRELEGDNPKIASSNAQVISRWFEGNLVLLNPITKKLYIDTFNFDTYQWTSTEIENCWKDDSIERLRSVEMVDDKIYGMMEYKDGKEQKYEIRVLELMPKLGDVCLLDLVDQVMIDERDNPVKLDDDKVEAFKTKMTPTSRARFDNMISWRKTETNRALISRLIEELVEDRKKDTRGEREKEFLERYDRICEIEF